MVELTEEILEALKQELRLPITRRCALAVLGLRWSDFVAWRKVGDADLDCGNRESVAARLVTETNRAMATAEKECVKMAYDSAVDGGRNMGAQWLLERRYGWREVVAMEGVDAVDTTPAFAAALVKMIADRQEIERKELAAPALMLERMESTEIVYGVRMRIGVVEGDKQAKP